MLYLTFLTGHFIHWPWWQQLASYNSNMSDFPSATPHNSLSASVHSDPAEWDAYGNSKLTQTQSRVSKDMGAGGNFLASILRDRNPLNTFPSIAFLDHFNYLLCRALEDLVRLGTEVTFEKVP